jgi:hypothetical protein
LRRGAQLAGAERGRRTSDAGQVGFDRIKTFGQRHGSREACALDAEAGLGGNPARILELVDYEAVSASWGKAQRVGMARPLFRLGAGLALRGHLAFVIPAAAVAPKPLQTVATAT